MLILLYTLQIQQGKINPDKVLNVFLPLFMALFAAGQAQLMFPDVAKGKAAAASVFRIIDREPKIDNMSEKGISPLACEGRISFYKVKFSYPTRPDTRVLKNFSMEIAEGKSMAVVGESGSGKSTIVGLMERFYSPSSGSILLDDVNIETINIRWLRRQIGLVGQEPVLFNMTIKENITYGSNVADEEAIIHAAKVAHAHDFIMEAAEGYDTLLGDGGISLSGGQKQRVAIARAILKDPKVRSVFRSFFCCTWYTVIGTTSSFSSCWIATQCHCYMPQILLMDEATSALDSESEAAVVEALKEVMIGKTSIIIAHKYVYLSMYCWCVDIWRGHLLFTSLYPYIRRLVTVEDADCISVLDKGVIVEQGTHSELEKRKGMYSELLKMQRGH